MKNRIYANAAFSFLAIALALTEAFWLVVAPFILVFTLVSYLDSVVSKNPVVESNYLAYTISNWGVALIAISGFVFAFLITYTAALVN